MERTSSRGLHGSPVRGSGAPLRPFQTVRFDDSRTVTVAHSITTPTRCCRVIGLIGGVAVAAIFLSDPVAAASYDSSTEELIQGLNRLLTYIPVPIAIAVEIVLIYTAIRFRNNDDPKPTEERRWLEISWTVVTALILLVVGVMSYQVMAHPDVTTTPQQVSDIDGGQPDVVIVGHQWYWEVRYPGQNVTIQSTDTFYLPADEDLFEKAREADLPDGDHGTLEVSQGEYILEAAEAQGYDWPFSCRAGACANCAAILVEGEVEMEMQQILSDEEVTEKNVRLTCVGTPVTDEVKLVYNAKHLDYLQNRVI